MATISNDHDLREALNRLSPVQQRVLGARFAESVIRLCKDERVRRAIGKAQETGVSEVELEDAFRAAKGYATKTYAECGKDTNWLAQADHFVAAAVAAALTPEALAPERGGRAWKAAVQVRMAVNCEAMEREEGDTESEAQRQYRIAEALL